MSENDSFIDEVSEEVRRDQLFGYFKRYGWIALAVVLGLVGASAYNEWQKARTVSQSQSAGDSILAALEIDDPVTRASALAELGFEDNGRLALVKLQEAAALTEADRIDEAKAVLEAVASLPDIEVAYTDLAKLKLAMIDPDSDATAQVLEELAIAGRPYRLVAIEMRALAHVRGNDTDAALADFALILQDPRASQALRDRAQQMTVVLGGELPQRPSLLPAPGNG